jgi:hypothetical protein
MRRRAHDDDPEGGRLDADDEKDARALGEELEDGSLDPDELTGEPARWDEGSDDET